MSDMFTEKKMQKKNRFIKLENLKSHQRHPENGVAIVLLLSLLLVESQIFK